MRTSKITLPSLIAVNGAPSSGWRRISFRATVCLVILGRKRHKKC